ncbi:MAG: transglycosylase SLT domain-containing protein [Cyanobacterium sp. T60_A2020_053]|nr:transglycosylase SLT domain-containing protein [Cyanobacterium sp. T60_A2020_053]
MNSKKSRLILPLSTLVLLASGVIGATYLTPQFGKIWDKVILPRFEEAPEYRLDAPSEVLALAPDPPAERRAKLAEIASRPDSSLDRARARYLLASDLINEDFDGGLAWTYLENLELQYPILAPSILYKQGRAFELMNDRTRGEEFWQKLITEYPTSPITVNAYYKLGENDESYWRIAIESFPQHPLSQTMMYELLTDNPDQMDLMLKLVQHDITAKSDPIRDRLVSEYAEKLTPSQWQIIADSYWRRGQFLSGAQSYVKAPSTAENLYRIARGYQVSEKKNEAIIGYENLIKQFPEATETGLGLRRLATLVSGEKALNYLTQVDERFPAEAPSALSQKIVLLNSLGRGNEATGARSELLQKYSNSDEAGDYRWQIARDFASRGDTASAWQWAQQIAVNNPDSSVAPKASFWVGKWARGLGQTAEAEKAFQYVLEKHPHSYYAWRSAVNLGQDVGDFTTIKNRSFTIETPTARAILPGGSTMFKELYLLGQDEDAKTLFQAEIIDPENISVTEQFSQAVLLQLEGKYLQSISMIWNLSNREKPDDLRQWHILRSSPEYWQALFPLPYKEQIVKWSTERKLNPFLVTALIRQESRFQPLIKSPVGATGLMQVMPDTGEWIAPQIGLADYSLTDPDDSINLGTWYLDYTHRTYDNNSMLAIASYNAGPGNISSWLQEYDISDFDQFVENIPFPETKNYVETVFGNYWNYVNLYKDNG